MRLTHANYLLGMFIAVLLLAACFVSHAEPIDSLQKQINTKQHELYSDAAFGHELSQLEPEAIPGFLSYLLKSKLKDTLAVYHMAAVVKDIAHMKRQQAQVMVLSSNKTLPYVAEYQKKQTQTVAMIDDWYSNQGMNDEPVIQHSRLQFEHNNNLR